SYHAFRTQPNGRINRASDLGTLGGAWSTARDINDAGVVVGIADVPRDQWHAFVYLDGEGMLDLNRLIAGGLPEGWTLVSAMGINNKGQIVGMAGVSPAIGGGSWVGSYERAFLLTPVPEPAL